MQGEAVFALGYGASKNAISATACYAGIMIAAQCQVRFERENP